MKKLIKFFSHETTFQRIDCIFIYLIYLAVVGLYVLYFQS